MSTFLHDAMRGALPTRVVPADALPPASTPGKWAKPLRVLGDRGFVELLRMCQGTVMPLHRHTGEVHEHQLAGHRQLCSGEILGPGDSVFEPAGHVDWRKAAGEEDTLALSVVMGEVDFIGPGGQAQGRADYERHCREHRLPLHDLRER